MPRTNSKANDIDKKVGTRVEKLRVINGISRQELAKDVGVTHQQLQKYEKGLNRISAGRLAGLAKSLGQKVEYFFDDVCEEKDYLPDQHKRMCIEVSRNFLKIKSPIQQNAVNLLVRSLAEDN